MGVCRLCVGWGVGPAFIFGLVSLVWQLSECFMNEWGLLTLRSVWVVDSRDGKHGVAFESINLS